MLKADTLRRPPRRRGSTRRPQPIAGQPFTDDDPLFTVIVTDYEPSVSRDLFRRKMACLAAQTCDDFEVLVYHDGPKSQSYAEDLVDGPMHPDTRFFESAVRAGDWGHAGRDLGIRAARGRWIIHTNADNVFYPNLIAVLKQWVTDPGPWAFAYPPKKYPIGVKSLAEWLDKTSGTDFVVPQVLESSEPQILVYSIVMKGMVTIRGNQIRVRGAAERHGVVFGGIPVSYGQIDAMQLVMQRSL